MTQRAKIIESVDRAQRELVSALAALDHIPDIDRDGIAFTAHALNNYLSVCSGTIELLTASLQNYGDEEVHIMLDLLRQATEMMSHSVCRLIYGADSRPPKLVSTPVNLSRLIERIAQFYSGIAASKSIELLYTPTLEAIQVWTDRVAVSAILDNFLSNAIKYSPRGRRIWIRLERKGANAVCSVKDEGPGLRPDEVKRIFERGAKLTPRPTAGEPSAGYGLSVARELAEMLGGEIRCESDPAVGSTFSLSLPLDREDAAS